MSLDMKTEKWGSYYLLLPNILYPFPTLTGQKWGYRNAKTTFYVRTTNLYSQSLAYLNLIKEKLFTFSDGFDE